MFKECEMNEKCEARLDSIEKQLVRYNTSLEHHIKRTDELQDFVKAQAENNEKVLNLVVKQAEVARKDNMKVIKISLGIFAAIAALVTALAAWLANN